MSHARDLTRLTERLTERLIHETRAFEARRPQDAAPGMAETQEMANAYRRETARLKADPSLVATAPVGERQTLALAVQALEAVLVRHSRVVEAARVVSEGLTRAIAEEVAAARAKGTGYGSAGLAYAGDTRAVALNRTA